MQQFQIVSVCYEVSVCVCLLSRSLYSISGRCLVLRDAALCTLSTARSRRHRQSAIACSGVAKVYHLCGFFNASVMLCK